MEKIKYPRIGETVHCHTLKNGLPVYFVPRKGFARKYALFATRYGGMDLRFQLNGQWLDTPAGIAHYLEHKMFDTEEGNALQELAKNGARAIILIVIQMKGVHVFRPNWHTHAEFGLALCDAQAAGVEIIAVDCAVKPGEAKIDQWIPVGLSVPD